MPGTLGNATFDSPSYLDKPILDGVEMVGLPKANDRQESGGASIWEAQNGNTGVWLDYFEDDQPFPMGYFSWSFDLQAIQETGWRKVKQLARSAKTVNFTDFGYVEEVFSAGPELTTFALPSSRPTAKSVIGGSFPSAVYPVRAFLNDVEQTVIESGSPSAGEVKVVGAAVTTPTLTSGDELVIEYVPTFRVVVLLDGPQTYPQYNDLRQSARLVEIKA